MHSKIKTIIAVTGIRGSGKSEVSKLGKQYGFSIITMEDYYMKYGGMYPNHHIQEMPKVIDTLFSEACKDIMVSKASKIVFESTGTNPRWRKLIDELKKQHKVQVLQVSVNAAIALKRMGVRGWDKNYPTTEKETLSIISKQSNIKPDIVIENNGSLEAFKKEVRGYFDRQK